MAKEVTLKVYSQEEKNAWVESLKMHGAMFDTKKNVWKIQGGDEEYEVSFREGIVHTTFVNGETHPLYQEMFSKKGVQVSESPEVWVFDVPENGVLLRETLVAIG